MKKIIIASILALVLCVGAFALVACNDDSEVKPEAVTEADVQTMGYTVASAATMLDVTGSVGSSAFAGTASDEVVPEKFWEQLDMFEQFIDRTDVQVEAGASDRDGFEFMVTVTTANIAGEARVYTFYYNTVAASEVTEDTADVGIAIKGVLDLNGREYGISGAFTLDEENADNGHLFNFSISDANGNSISVKEEHTLVDGKFGEKFVYTFAPVSEYIPDYTFSLSFEQNGAAGETLVVESVLSDIVTTVRYTREYDEETGEFYLNVNVKAVNFIGADIEVRYEKNDDGTYSREISVSADIDIDGLDDLF